MWLYFNNKGQLITALEHGTPARAGTTNFQIFAVFEGVNVDNISDISATIKLKKPDLTGSEYPILLMDNASADFSLIGDEVQHPDSVAPFQVGAKYYGFLFDFANFNPDQTTEILLDTPGLWEAIITLITGVGMYSVQGVATFDVGGTGTEEPTPITYEVIINQMIAMLGDKVNFNQVILAVNNISEVVIEGYEEGQMFVDKTTGIFYKISGGELVYVADFGDTLNLENNIGDYSLRQRASTDSHSKGGTAVGNNSIALGFGDNYEYEVYINGTTITFSEAADPNWRNLVCKYGEEFRRITSVFGNTIAIESAFSTTSGSITVNIISQVAMGVASSVKGKFSQAFGECSSAEGIATKAVGNASHSEGYYSLANKNYSHAEGMYTIADGVAQTVCGKYNAIDDNALFIVGVGTGTSDADRKNALVVNVDGATIISDAKLSNGRISFISYTHSIRFDEDEMEFDFSSGTGKTGLRIKGEAPYGDLIISNDGKITGTEPVAPGYGVETYLALPSKGTSSNYATIAVVDDITQKATCLYRHHFDIPLNNTDLAIIPAGYAVNINVNALSTSGTAWETLSELDGGGFIVSAFGTMCLISDPTQIDTTRVFELKIYYNALGTLLLNIHDLTDNSVTAVAITSVSSGQTPSTYEIDDSVAKL